MSFLSNKFRLETKSLEQQVAKFMTNNNDINLIIAPDNSNLEYSMIGANNYSNIQAYVRLTSNGILNTIAEFNDCNINFYRDTIVRGNLIVDGYILALGLNVVLDKDDLHTNLYNTNINVTSNVLAQKYIKLIDEHVTTTSNIIINEILQAYSNVYVVGLDILSSNTSEDAASLLNLQNVFDDTKFDIRLNTKTVDSLQQGSANKYIINDKYDDNELIINGILWTSNIQSGSNVYVDTANIMSYSGDGSYITNIYIGDGTTNSLLEGSNLFYRSSYVGDLCDASNLFTSNYIQLQDTQIQSSLIFNTSNYIQYASNEIQRYMVVEYQNLSNYISCNVYYNIQDTKQQNLGNISSNYPVIKINNINQTPVLISGNDYYFAFTNTSSLNTIIFNQDTKCQLFMIGGGGGAGFEGNSGGGGGAGAYYYNDNFTFASGTYTFNIGAGGVVEGGQAATNGGDTFIQTNNTDILVNGLQLRCKGGGRGGSKKTNATAGGNGGCGGGGVGYGITDAVNMYIFNGGTTNNTGTVGSGNNGGYGKQHEPSFSLGGGGGGGIGGIGQNGTEEGGNGGTALVFSIKGYEEVYGGGGGGGEWSGLPTVDEPAGSGGGAYLSNGTYVKVGGDAKGLAPVNSSGVSNTGSGGGAGGNGSAGIIIIRYTLSQFDITTSATIQSNIIQTADTNMSNLTSSTYTNQMASIMNISNILADNILKNFQTTTTSILNTSNVATNYLNNMNSLINTSNDTNANQIIQYMYNIFANISNTINIGSNFIENAIDIKESDINDYLVFTSNNILNKINIEYISLSNLVFLNSNIETAFMHSNIQGLSNMVTNASNSQLIYMNSSIQNLSNYEYTKTVTIDTLFSNLATFTRRNIQNASNYITILNDLFRTNNTNQYVNIITFNDNTFNSVTSTFANGLDAQSNLSYNTLKNTSNTITNRISSLNTNLIPEGSSNFYYKEYKFNEFFDTLDYNKIANGTSNRFIVNNTYNSNLFVSATLSASNMTIYGNLSTINTNVYQSGSSLINGSNIVNLQISQMNNLSDILHILNVNQNTILLIKGNNKVGINTNNPLYELDVAGSIRGHKFIGNGIGIIDANLSDKQTKDLAEGSNLYYTDERVATIADASNLNMSNYIFNISNVLFQSFVQTINTSNYIQQTNIKLNVDIDSHSTNISNYVMMYSNINTTNIIHDNQNISNYVVFNSNQFMQTLNNLILNQQNYRVTTSNNIIYDIHTNHTALSNMIMHLSYELLNHVNWSNIYGSNEILSNSNILSKQMTEYAIELNQSNYMFLTCNNILGSLYILNYNISNYVNYASNMINNNVTVFDVNINNYVSFSSNNVIFFTSNLLDDLRLLKNTYTLTDITDSNVINTINKIKTNRWQEPSNYNSLTNQYIYYDEGNIGIGNTVPYGASLEILTNTSYHSLKTNNPIWTNMGTISSSDERIKRNLKDIEDQNALRQILAIEPKQYNYIDIEKSGENIYGFIAQQVKSVCPIAVSLQTEAIPNINIFGNLTNSIIRINKYQKDLSVIQSNVTVVIIDSHGIKYREVVEYVIGYDNDFFSFKIYNTSMIADSTVFVYGTLVDDYHALDKSYIYTLNICALQDLHRRYQYALTSLNVFDNYENILTSNILRLSNDMNMIEESIKGISFETIESRQMSLKDNIYILQNITSNLIENINTYQDAMWYNVQSNLSIIQKENDDLMIMNTALLNEHNDLKDKIRNYTNEITTIKSIMQINNIV